MQRHRKALLHGLGTVLVWSRLLFAYLGVLIIATILGEAIHPVIVAGVALIIAGVLIQQAQPEAARAGQ